MFKTIKTIDELKQFTLSDLKKTFQFSGMFGVFLKCKIDHRESKTESKQKWSLVLL